ncbi:MAG: hypothetical protein F6K21_30165 [Symploca sp. SIO2D2]|nr:hypothetical protein [Symploca sp. SIO2D2]
MSSDRLREAEENLNDLRQQLAGKKRTLVTIAPEEEVRIEQQINKLKAKIKRFEEEYWQILADESDAVDIPEPAPEVIVAEIVEKAGQLQTSQQYSDEVLEWLQKIHAEVSQPETTAAAKLKGALSLVPPFVNLSYEAELDTETFLRTHFPTFTKWAKKLAKKS